MPEVFREEDHGHPALTDLSLDAISVSDPFLELFLEIRHAPMIPGDP
jgi:hypothetical protein